MMTRSTVGPAPGGIVPDPFRFSSEDMRRQGLRNMLVPATLPWAAGLAVAAEYAALTCGARRRTETISPWR